VILEHKIDVARDPAVDTSTRPLKACTPTKRRANWADLRSPTRGRRAKRRLPPRARVQIRGGNEP